MIKALYFVYIYYILMAVDNILHQFNVNVINNIDLKNWNARKERKRIAEIPSRI